MKKESVRFAAGLILTVMGLTGGALAWGLSTFETKEHVREDVISRLDRMENKIDRILERPSSN